MKMRFEIEDFLNKEIKKHFHTRKLKTIEKVSKKIKGLGYIELTFTKGCFDRVCTNKTDDETDEVFYEIFSRDIDDISKDIKYNFRTAIRIEMAYSEHTQRRQKRAARVLVMGEKAMRGVL